MRQPFNLLFRHQTSIEMLRERDAFEPGLRPNGFIFHMSRCGSTLVSQMLGAIARTVVISEASPIDATLRAHLRAPGLDENEQADWLRWMVSALGQRRRGDEKHFFIKLDCWDTLSLPLIRRTFPEVPWVFVYRNPVEVMVSQLKRRGAHLVPGVIEPVLFGLDNEAIFRMCPEEYCARVLARICEAALKHHKDGGLLVNYNQLPQDAQTFVMDHFAVHPSAEDLEAINRVARLDSKNSSLPFTDDTEAKNRSASDKMRRMADKWIVPVYERLEAARRACQR